MLRSSRSFRGRRASSTSSSVRLFAAIAANSGNQSHWKAAKSAELTCHTEDGKEMKLDSEKLGIKGVVEEVDRHSRILARNDELNGN